ncbi:hypothetical protein ACHAW6_001206 [Cyclotella cf. meneghiniana]
MQLNCWVQHLVSCQLTSLLAASMHQEQWPSSCVRLQQILFD